jgi:hypothetical protein
LFSAVEIRFDSRNYQNGLFFPSRLASDTDIYRQIARFIVSRAAVSVGTAVALSGGGS